MGGVCHDAFKPKKCEVMIPTRFLRKYWNHQNLNFEINESLLACSKEKRASMLQQFESTEFHATCCLLTCLLGFIEQPGIK